MKKLSNQEKKLKEVLEGISFEIDTSAIWDEVKDHVPVEKKDNKKPVWLLLSAFVLTTCMPALFLYSFNVNAVDSSITEVIPFKAIEVETEIDVTQSETIQPSLIENNTETPEGDITSRTTTNETNVAAENTNDLTQKILVTRNNNSNTTTTLINQKLTNNSNILTASITGKEDRNLPIMPSANTAYALLSAPEYLQRRNYHLFTDQENEFDNRTSLIPIEPLQENKLTKRSYIQIRSGINKSFVTNALLETDGELVTESLDKERGVIGQSYSVAFGREIKNGWNIGLGLSYDYNVVSYNNSDTQVNETEVSGVTQRLIDASGNVSETQGNVVTTETIHNRINWHRRHQRINLFASVSKTVMSIGLLSLSGELAASYNLSATHSGYHFDKYSNEITKFDSADNSLYRDRQGLSLIPGLSLSYDWGNWVIGMHSSYNLPFRSITQDNNYYKSNYKFLGLQLQLSHRL